MKLIEDVNFDNNPAIALERLICCRFSVSEDRSFKAYEEFIMPDGDRLRLVHYSFGYVTACRMTDKEIVAAMAKRLWDDIKFAWPPGTFLMWRRFPHISEENEKENEWFDRVGGESSEENTIMDNWRTKITLRIGSFTPPATSSIRDGDMLNEF